MLSIQVHFLPQSINACELRDAIVIVIDVLRATTTIAAAIAAGAREVIPCGEISEAEAIFAKYAPGEAILGGERGGLPVPGFALGNSPRDYTPERVGGKTVVFTTTNGTQALTRCQQAGRVYTAGFVNASAIVEATRKASTGRENQIHLLCAGTDGMITREDVLLAGCLAQKLAPFLDLPVGMAPEFGDEGAIAVAAWKEFLHRSDATDTTINAKQLAIALGDSRGGHNLQTLHLAGDIFDAAHVDRWNCVTELHLPTWTIRDTRPRK